MKEAAPDLKELFSLGPANPAAGFPTREFPKSPTNFEAAYTRYYDALASLAQKFLEALTIPLNLPTVSTRVFAPQQLILILFPLVFIELSPPYIYMILC